MQERFLIKTTVMKKFILLVVVIFCCHDLFAQDEEPEGFKNEKFFAGGNFGLSIGSYTLINISPQIGYRFNKYVSSGLGLNLQYASQKEKDQFGNDYSKTSQGIIGLSLFGRVYPVQKLLIQVQTEINYIFGNIKYYRPPEQTYNLDAEIVPS